MKRSELVAGQDYAARRGIGTYRYLLLSTDPFLDDHPNGHWGDRHREPRTFEFDVAGGIQIAAYAREPLPADKAAPKGVLVVEYRHDGTLLEQAQVISLGSILRTWQDWNEEQERESAARRERQEAQQRCDAVAAAQVEAINADLVRRGESVTVAPERSLGYSDNVVISREALMRLLSSAEADGRS